MSKLFGKEVRSIEVSEPEYNDGGFQDMEKSPEPLANFTCEVYPGVSQVFYFDYENNVLYVDMTEISDRDGVAYQKLRAITKDSKGKDDRRLWHQTRRYRKRIKQGFIRVFYETLKSVIVTHFDQPQQSDTSDDYAPLISEEVTTAKAGADGVPLITKVLEMSKPSASARGEGKLDPLDGAQIAQYYTGLN